MELEGKVVDSRPFRCKYCGKKYHDMRTLMEHMKFCEESGKELWFDFVLSLPKRHFDEGV